MTGLIIAAGRGSRLGELTKSIPKPLIQVGGRPMIWYSLDLLESLGIRKVVVVTGYKGEMVRDYLASNQVTADFPGLHIVFAQSNSWSDTARKPFDYLDSLLAAKPSTTAGDFCVIHPDQIFFDSAEVSRALDAFQTLRPTLLLLWRSVSARHYVKMRLVPYREKVLRVFEYLPNYPEANLPVALGLTFCDQAYWAYIETGAIERRFAPRLALSENRVLLAWPYEQGWCEVNTVDDLAQLRRLFERMLASRPRRKGL